MSFQLEIGVGYLLQQTSYLKYHTILQDYLWGVFDLQMVVILKPECNNQYN